MKILSAFDISDFFLTCIDEDSGDLISNLKLQKLLYYAQGVCLAMYDIPLFNEKILAWEHGPVVVEVYNKYKLFGSGALEKPESINFGKYNENQKEVMKEVYNVYGQFSAWALRNMTHNEMPWKNTPRDLEISHDILKSYFKTQLQ